MLKEGKFSFNQQVSLLQKKKIKIQDTKNI